MAKSEKAAAGIKDVARLAGVSISTVSNVVNQTKNVSPKLTEKVKQAVQTLDYEANPMGKELKSSKTNRIGVVVPSFNQVSFPAMLQGIYEAGLQYGYIVSIFETGGDMAREKACIKVLQQAWADGILLMSCANPNHAPERSHIRFLIRSGCRRKRTPVVSMQSVLAPEIDAVIIDEQKAAQAAVKHLISLGRREIAHIAGPYKSLAGAQRLLGFRSAAEEAGLQVDESLICEGDFSLMSGYRCMEKLLAGNRQITAVFAANEQMGIGAIRALLDKGYEVPGDAAVAGIESNLPSELITPALTGVSLPKYEMGYQAMQLLSERIASPKSPKRVLTLETKLVVRQSTSEKGDGMWNLSGW